MQPTDLLGEYSWKEHALQGREPEARGLLDDGPWSSVMQRGGISQEGGKSLMWFLSGEHLSRQRIFSCGKVWGPHASPERAERRTAVQPLRERAFAVRPTCAASADGAERAPRHFLYRSPKDVFFGPIQGPDLRNWV